MRLSLKMRNNLDPHITVILQFGYLLKHGIFGLFLFLNCICHVPNCHSAKGKSIEKCVPVTFRVTFCLPLPENIQNSHLGLYFTSLCLFASVDFS